MTTPDLQDDSWISGLIAHECSQETFERLRSAIQAPNVAGEASAMLDTTFSSIAQSFLSNVDSDELGYMGVKYISSCWPLVRTSDAFRTVLCSLSSSGVNMEGAGNPSEIFNLFKRLLDNVATDIAQALSAHPAMQPTRARRSTRSSAASICPSDDLDDGGTPSTKSASRSGLFDLTDSQSNLELKNILELMLLVEIFKQDYIQSCGTLEEFRCSPMDLRETLSCRVGKSKELLFTKMLSAYAFNARGPVKQVVVQIVGLLAQLQSFELTTTSKFLDVSEECKLFPVYKETLQTISWLASFALSSDETGGGIEVLQQSFLDCGISWALLHGFETVAIPAVRVMLALLTLANSSRISSSGSPQKVLSFLQRSIKGLQTGRYASQLFVEGMTLMLESTPIGTSLAPRRTADGETDIDSNGSETTSLEIYWCMIYFYVSGVCSYMEPLTSNEKMDLEVTLEMMFSGLRQESLIVSEYDGNGSGYVGTGATGRLHSSAKDGSEYYMKILFLMASI